MPLSTVPPDQKSKHPMIGSIVGSVLGGLLLTILVAWALWTWRKAYRKRVNKEDDTLPQPFMLPENDESQVPERAHDQKSRADIRRNERANYSPMNQSQGASSSSAPSSSRDFLSMNTRLGELTAELQALRRELRDDQTPTNFPPPSYITSY